MRILLIAPSLDGISWSLETEMISGNFTITPLIGEVTHERITRASTKARFDIVHVASHSSKAGVQISGGLLTKEELAQIAKQVNAELVFLNSCDSALVGQFIVDRGVPLTISYTVDVMDTTALRTAAYYYEALHDAKGDFRKAYERVSPKDGTLAIFAGAGYLDRLITPLLQMIQDVKDSLTKLQSNVASGQKTLLSLIAGAVVAMLVINGMSLWWTSAQAANDTVVESPSRQGERGTPISPIVPAATQIGSGTIPNVTATPGPVATEQTNAKTPTETNTPVATATDTPTKDSGKPTEKPTENPTEKPTDAPTKDNGKPTEKPTNGNVTPTRKPTKTPTETETNTPKPTETWTGTPTFAPSDTETQIPLPTPTPTPDEEIQPTATDTRLPPDTPTQTVAPTIPTAPTLPTATNTLAPCAVVE